MAVEVSTQLRKEIVAKLKSGESTKQLRDQYDLPHQTLAKIRREAGLLAPSKVQRHAAKPNRAASLSLEDVRKNVQAVIEGLEAEKEAHMQRVRELDDELDHARKILKTMA